MRSWVEVDEHDRQYVVRAGTGLITAVVPIGIADSGDLCELYRVEISCDVPNGRSSAVRYSAHPVVAAQDPLADFAFAALGNVWAVAWTIEWRRHEWVPDEVPVGSLDLASDARCLLVGLDRARLPEVVDLSVTGLSSMWALDERS